MSGDEGKPVRLAFQVQVRVTCLECGGAANDEDHAGPYLHQAHVEFGPEAFMEDPLDLGYVEFPRSSLAHMPYVEDHEGNDIPDHPVLKALRGDPHA